MKHTEGPWKINGTGFHIETLEGKRICEMAVNEHDDNFSYEEYRANSELIASAPDLKLWKEQSMRVNMPLLEFMQNHPDMKVGDSCIEKAIEFIRERDSLKEQVTYLENEYKNKAH